MGFRPLRKGGSKAGSKRNDGDGDNSSASDRGFAPGGTTPGSDQDAAESGVPVSSREEGNHYQYNVDSYDSYDSGPQRAGGRGGGGGGDDGSYERGQGEDGGSVAVQRQRARAQKKRRFMIGGALFGTLIVLAGAAVGGYYIWDTQFRDKSTDSSGDDTGNKDIIGEDDGNMTDTNTTQIGEGEGVRYCALFGTASPGSGKEKGDIISGLRHRRRMQAGEDDLDNINYLMEGDGEKDTNVTDSITTTISTDATGPTCHPEQVMCTSDSDCAEAFGAIDGLHYGSCVDTCVTQEPPPDDQEGAVKYCAGNMSPTFLYEGEDNAPKATGRKERDRTICHPSKVVCTTDMDCAGKSVEHSDGSMVPTDYCTSDCEDLLMTEPPPLVEASNFTTVLTLVGRDDCVLSLDEQALFCKGVSELAASGTSSNGTNATAEGSETNSTDAAVIPECEVFDQECLGSLSRRNLLRKRSLQSEGETASVELRYQLTWEVTADGDTEDIPVSTSYADEFLQSVSSPASTFSDDLAAMLKEESGGSMDVVSVSVPELYIVDMTTDGTNVTSNATNVTDMNITAFGYCGFSPEDPESSTSGFDRNASCTDVPCGDDSDCLEFEEGIAMSCLEMCLSNETDTPAMNETVTPPMNETVTSSLNETITPTSNETSFSNETILPVQNNTAYNETSSNNETSIDNTTSTTGVGFCGYIAASTTNSSVTNSSSSDTEDAGETICHESFVECSSDDDCSLLDKLEESVPDGKVYTCLASCANEPSGEDEDFEDGVDYYFYNETEITFNATNTTTTTNATDTSQEESLLNTTYPELNGTVTEMNTTETSNSTDSTVNVTDVSEILDSMMEGYCGYQIPSSSNDTATSAEENICDASGQRCSDDEDCSVAGDGLMCLETCVSQSEEYYPETNATTSSADSSSSKRCAIPVEPDPDATDLVYTSAGVALSCAPNNDSTCFADAECAFELDSTIAVCVSECGSSTGTNSTRI